MWIRVVDTNPTYASRRMRMVYDMLNERLGLMTQRRSDRWEGKGWLEAEEGNEGKGKHNGRMESKLGD